MWGTLAQTFLCFPHGVWDTDLGSLPHYQCASACISFKVQDFQTAEQCTYTSILPHLSISLCQQAIFLHTGVFCYADVMTGLHVLFICARLLLAVGCLPLGTILIDARVPIVLSVDVFCSFFFNLKGKKAHCPRKLTRALYQLLMGNKG